jgi:hypothetical protein
VLECQNISPSVTGQSQLVFSTRNFIERFRSHRALPHPESTCPGCRGIRDVVSLSSIRLARAIESGDQRSVSVLRGVVERLHVAWQGPTTDAPLNQNC